MRDNSEKKFLCPCCDQMVNSLHDTSIVPKPNIRDCISESSRRFYQLQVEFKDEELLTCRDCLNEAIAHSVNSGRLGARGH